MGKPRLYSGLCSMFLQDFPSSGLSHLHPPDAWHCCWIQNRLHGPAWEPAASVQCHLLAPSLFSLYLSSPTIFPSLFPLSFLCIPPLPSFSLYRYETAVSHIKYYYRKMCCCWSESVFVRGLWVSFCQQSNKNWGFDSRLSIWTWMVYFLVLYLICWRVEFCKMCWSIWLKEIICIYPNIRLNECNNGKDHTMAAVHSFRFLPL